jgi:hypothetical protein
MMQSQDLAGKREAQRTGPPSKLKEEIEKSSLKDSVVRETAKLYKFSTAAG